MTRTLRNDDVEVELGDGTITLRWPSCGITLGPAAAHVTLGDGSRDSDGHPGAWRVDATASGGRARWTPAGDSLWLEVHVPVHGSLVDVRAGYHALAPGTVERIVVLEGPVAPSPDTRLVNGYDSWSWSGVRAARDAGQSFWSAAVHGEAGVLALAARGAEQWCTRIAHDDANISVECGATPAVEPADRTWGYSAAVPAGAAHPVTAGDEVASETIVLTASADHLSPVEAVAAAASRRAWHGAPVLGWESWYHYGLLVDPDTLLANARILRERYRDRVGFDLFQIDDGWQQTYGAWWPNARFPDGIGPLVDEIHGLGLRAGLWLAPFMVQPDAPGLGREHPEWMLRDDSGEPIRDRYGRWGLDASNPAALDWLRDLGATVRDWNVDMVKLDFLYLGAQEARRHDARVTGVQALRQGLRAFTTPLGDDVYVLGCGAPMLPLVGIAHGNRIGHDLAVPVLLREFGQPVGEGWRGFDGIRAQARNAAARWALHRRWFDADPDVVMAWGSDGRGGADGYTLDDSRTLALLAALLGGPFLLADDLAALLPEERAVLEDPEILDLAWGPSFRPVDLWDHVDAPEPEQFFATPADLPSVWVASRGEHTITALCNWTDDAAIRRTPDGASFEVGPHAIRLLSPATARAPHGAG